MKRQKYNTMELDKILDIRESDPNLAVKLYDEYIKKYQNDYVSYVYYANQLICMGKIKEAEKILNISNELIASDKHLNNNHSDKVKIYYQHINYTMVKMLILQKRYEDALIYIKKHSHDMQYRDKCLATLYCLKNINNLNREKQDEDSYLLRQLLNYDEDEFLQHIQKHFYCNNPSGINSCFTSSFPINDVLNEVKKYIPSDKAFYYDITSDMYYFRYDYCGKHDKKVQNYFKAVCIHGTNEIITMYPINFGENTNYIDLNYMNLNNDNFDDHKKESDRIAKFYKRYSERKS